MPADSLMCSCSGSVFSFFIVSPENRSPFRVAGSAIVCGRIVFMLTNTEPAGERSKDFVASDIQLDGKAQRAARCRCHCFLERNRVFPYPAHCSEEALTEDCVSSAQAAARPARITPFRRMATSLTSSRRLRSCFRVLLNAACVNKTASRGSSVN